MTPAWWNGARLETAAASLFTLVVAWPFLRPDRYVTGFDTVAYSGPNLDLTLRSMRGGRLLAGWNNAIFGGVPISATPRPARSTPPSGRSPGWTSARIGPGTCWWACTSACSPPGSSCWCGGVWTAAPAGVAAVLVVVGSGQVMIRSLFLEQIMVIAWTPWLLFAIDRVLVRRWRAVAGLAVVTALMLTAGHPQPVYLMVWLAGLWALVRAADRGAWRRLGAVAAGAALGAVIAAVQLLPSLDLSGRSAARAGGTWPGWAPGSSVVSRVLPGTLFGDVFAHDHPVTATTHEAMTFIGVAGALLALAGLAVVWCAGAGRPALRCAGPRWARRWPLRWARAGAGTRFLPYRAAFKLVPLFDLARVPARWTLLTVLGVGVLAAVGVDVLAGGAHAAVPGGRRRRAAGRWSWASGPSRCPPTGPLDVGAVRRRARGGAGGGCLGGGPAARPSPCGGRPRMGAARRHGWRAGRGRRGGGAGGGADRLQVHSVGRRSRPTSRSRPGARRSPRAVRRRPGLAITRDHLGNFPYLGASLRPNANVYQQCAASTATTAGSR